MYKQKKTCVVVPAYNEEALIGDVLSSIPDYIDNILVIDDHSSDRTVEIAGEYAGKDGRIAVIRHSSNEGVGAAIATGYTWARDNDMDIAVVMAGDNQMDPSDLALILDPVAADEADYSKGNRLFSGEAYKKIPKVRYFGNAVLSMLTKIASGYWHIADSQSGFAAINKKALHLIDWYKMYKRYGQPNDILVRLNVYNMRVKDVDVKPVYNIGEKSGIRIYKVIFTISWLLGTLFLWRMKEKYIIRNFHPLVFFYASGTVFLFATALLSIRLIWFWIQFGHIPPINALAAMFCFMSASMFTLFAMWFDMETNKDLKSKV
ncbi:glycosyltransferase family 2 protein [Fibrobacterota bacterium]